MDELDELLTQARHVPLNELGPLMQILARRIREHRARNEGYTPAEIFEPSCVIGGATICFELVVWTPSGLLLLKRGDIEHSWNGYFHIPGSLLRPGEGGDHVMKRVMKEVFHMPTDALQNRIRYVGTNIRSDNSERYGNCSSIIWTIDLSEGERKDLAEGEWKTISLAELSATAPEDVSEWAIPFHWRLLQTFFVHGSGSPPAVHIDV